MRASAPIDSSSTSQDASPATPVDPAQAAPPLAGARASAGARPEPSEEPSAGPREEPRAGPSEGPSEEPSLLTSPVAWVATAGGFGYAPIASGTFGSAAAVLLFWGISGLSLPVYALTVVTVTVLGIWASDRAEELFGKKDDGRIVIDEVAGQLITLTPVLVLAGSPVAARVGFGVGEITWWVLVVTAFVVFRLLDIWKPGPVRWAERSFPGGVGVMADDLLAGVFGGVLMTLPCYGLLLHRLGRVVGLERLAELGIVAGAVG